MSCVLTFGLSFFCVFQGSDKDEEYERFDNERSEEEDCFHFTNLLNYSVKTEISPKDIIFIEQRITIYPSLLEEDENLSKIIHKVFLPTLMIGPEEESLFENDYKKYLEKESKRGATCRLFGALFTIDDNVSEICSQEVQKLISTSNWKDMECGLLLAGTCLIGIDVLDT